MTTVALNSDFIVGWLSGMIDFLSIAAVYSGNRITPCEACPASWACTSDSEIDRAKISGVFHFIKILVDRDKSSSREMSVVETSVDICLPP